MEKLKIKNFKAIESVDKEIRIYEYTNVYHIIKNNKIYELNRICNKNGRYKMVNDRGDKSILLSIGDITIDYIKVLIDKVLNDE